VVGVTGVISGIKSPYSSSAKQMRLPGKAGIAPPIERELDSVRSRRSAGAAVVGVTGVMFGMNFSLFVVSKTCTAGTD
jgi:hypothetical protein